MTRRRRKTEPVRTADELLAEQRRRERTDKVRRRLLIAWIIGSMFAVGYGYKLLNDRADDGKRRDQRIASLVHANTIRAKQNQRLARENRALAKQGKEAHDVVCALRVDYRHRIARARRELKQSIDFLKSHPQGIPGISAKLLKTSVANQAGALDDLQDTQAVFNKVKTCKKGVKRSTTSSTP
jgi:hypothetical protein